MIYIRFALALDVLLLALQHLLPGKTRGALPLGGDSFVQLAALLLIAVAVNELRPRGKD